MSDEDEPREAPAAQSVALHRYFGGDWRVERRIDDRRAGEALIFDGAARFTAEDAPERLTETETGRLIRASGEGFEARRVTLWRFSDVATAALFFADGRPFCQFDFLQTPASATHHCGADHYDGEATIVSEGEWRLVWRVTGPRKDYVSATRYLRRDVDAP